MISIKDLFKHVKIKNDKKCNVFSIQIIINSNAANDYNNVDTFYVARVTRYLNDVLLT